jgi:hypothetical protein
MFETEHHQNTSALIHDCLALLCILFAADLWWIWGHIRLCFDVGGVVFFVLCAGGSRVLVCTCRVSIGVRCSVVLCCVMLCSGFS